jgi:hypothetical protein
LLPELVFASFGSARLLSHFERAFHNTLGQQTGPISRSDLDIICGATIVH